MLCPLADRTAKSIVSPLAKRVTSHADDLARQGLETQNNMLNHQLQQMSSALWQQQQHTTMLFQSAPRRPPPRPG